MNTTSPKPNVRAPMLEDEKPSARDFGIVIACCDQDYLFAKGCCASVRHFLGDVPICLIIDGTFSVTPLERAYGVVALYPKDLPDARLRRSSYGFGLTKMIAFWHSPWDKFLFMDSDTVMWGDVLAPARAVQDIVIDRFHGGHTDADIDHYFFDIRRLEQLVPAFTWRSHQADYFCTGVFAARRGVFDIDEYLALLAMQRANPGVLKLGEQGLLNLMIFRAADEGRIDLRSETMQYVTSGLDEAGLRARFPFVQGRPDVSGGSAVIHWAGAKPLMSRPAFYPEPMTFFRRKFLRDAHGLTGAKADLVLRAEDAWHHVLIAKNRLRRLAKRTLHRK